MTQDEAVRKVKKPKPPEVLIGYGMRPAPEESVEELLLRRACERAALELAFEKAEQERERILQTGRANLDELHKKNLALLDIQIDGRRPVPKVQAAKVATTGSKIKRLRVECGWSQNVLATKTGLDKKQIQRHENDRVKPTPATMKVYADAFAKDLKRPISALDIAG